PNKAELKLHESPTRGVACLASPTVYGEVIRPGETGLVYSSPDHFAEQLTRLIDDVVFRRRMAENAYRYVAEHRLLGHNYTMRHDWYRSMLDRLPELNRELR